MNYLVMECHPGYAIVLDKEGRFLRVANMGYEVGQQITHVIESEEPVRSHILWNKHTIELLASAACLCLILLGAWIFLLLPFGTVQMQINPNILMSVNRFHYVIDAEGLNEDGKSLLKDVSIFGKKIDILSEELADKAVKMGYLSEDGQITLTVDGKNTTWKTTTEELLILELDVHLNHTITIELSEEPLKNESVTPHTNEIKIPVPPNAPSDHDTPVRNSQHNIGTESNDDSEVDDYDDGDYDDDDYEDNDSEDDDYKDNNSDDDVSEDDNHNED